MNADAKTTLNTDPNKGPHRLPFNVETVSAKRGVGTTADHASRPNQDLKARRPGQDFESYTLRSRKPRAVQRGLHKGEGRYLQVTQS